MAESTDASRPREVLREGFWSAQPSLSLCNDLAEKGVVVAAVGGTCPVHGGDGCLFDYVQLRSARKQVSALLYHAEVSDDA